MAYKDGEYNFLQDRIKEGVGCIFLYERGRAIMRDVPQVGDRLAITSRARLHATGKVIVPFHVNKLVGVQMLGIQLTYIYKNPPYMRGQRRNYTRLKKAPTENG